MQGQVERVGQSVESDLSSVGQRPRMRNRKRNPGSRTTPTTYPWSLEPRRPLEVTGTRVKYTCRTIVAGFVIFERSFLSTITRRTPKWFPISSLQLLSHTLIPTGMKSKASIQRRPERNVPFDRSITRTRVYSYQSERPIYFFAEEHRYSRFNDANAGAST